MIDRRPSVIARCAGTTDVISAVNFTREHDLPLAVRGGGHNVAGNAVCDDGLTIDLAPMSSVRVDPKARTVRVGPGVTIADLDYETQAFGLAVPAGFNSATGIAGLTLGGGFGYRENYDRLVELKNGSDPENLFRLNQNIKPPA